MAKQTGLGDRFFISGYNMSGDVGSLGKIGGGPAPVEVTGIDKSGFERLGGLIDGSIEWSSFFNPGPAANAAHLVLGALPRTSVHTMYCRGATLGGAGAALIGKQGDYAGSRGDDGALTFDASVIPADGYGVEFGRQLTAGVRTDTTATNGSSVDGAAATAFGLTAYLQVFALTGTSVTVTIQSSSDNGGGDAFSAVTGAAFTAATTRGVQRISTASGLAIERYLRVVTSGTFTSAQFAVLVVRHEVAPLF